MENNKNNTNNNININIINNRNNKNILSLNDNFTERDMILGGCANGGN